MSLFRRSLYGEDPTFTNLFRMLDQFEDYSRESANNNGRHGRRHQRVVFTPRFDVRETENTYELHGELPGIEKDNLSIEFTEPQTMVVRGRVERTYTAGTPPASAPAVEDVQMSGAITEKEDWQSVAPTHQASVSDEETENAKESGEVTAPVAPAKQEVSKPVKEDAPKPKEHYWHQERSIGEFHRTFTFPGRVNDSEVSANLSNGILHITVPKATKHESRRIAIN